MNRREFLLAAAGVTGTVAATGTTLAQEGNQSGNASGNASGGNASGGSGSGNESGGGGGGGGGPVDYGLSGANGYDGPQSGQDATGQSEVTISVGAGDGFAFEPAAVHVDPGTTITWEWTGNGGAHNVHHQSGPGDFESSIQSSGTFEWQVPGDASGIAEYQCDPHAGQGMLGAIAVGSDVPRAPAGGAAAAEADPNPEHMGVPIQAHWVGIATVLMIISSLIFTFFLLKYGESANTKGGT